jgi:hypothetical protein
MHDCQPTTQLTATALAKSMTLSAHTSSIKVLAAMPGCKLFLPAALPAYPSQAKPHAQTTQISANQLAAPHYQNPNGHARLQAVANSHAR